MVTIPLLGGNYQGRAVQTSSQRMSVNLYPEANPPDGQALTQVTYYQTPGLDLQSTSPLIEGVRSLYRATNGDLYAVVGPFVYWISETYVWTAIGTIPDALTPAIFADNGLAIVLVTSSETGYAIDMVTHDFAAISDPSFLGATSLTQTDGFFVFNVPGTNEFYLSLNLVTYDMLTGVTARILDGFIDAGGTLYTAGTYTNVPLTGGTGSGAEATVTVAGGAVTAVTITDGGTGYVTNDTLSALAADIGGTGSGFTYTATVVATAFNPLDIASKSGSADPIVDVATVHGELWLIGELTTEIWAATGAADFYFQRIGGAYIDHGCAAQYSLAQQDIALFWLSQDRQGKGIVVMRQGASVLRISTHYIEEQIQSYASLSDAIGLCHQVDGHSFYVLTFPSADVTWAYDLATGQWHRRASIDGNGVLHRWRGNCFAFAFGDNLVGDYQNGRIYSVSGEFHTDNGTAIPRVITFPHVVADGRRVQHQSFMAKMQVGYQEGGDSANPPLASLSWSDDGGVSFGNAATQSIGATGQYLTAPTWQRLGMARDRVYQLAWDVDAYVSISAAFLTLQAAAT